MMQKTLSEHLSDSNAEAIEVTGVPNDQSHLDKARKPTPAEDCARTEMRRKGYPDELIDGTLAILRTHVGKQRRLPVWAEVCSKDMEAYWGDRSQEQREEDTCKAIRNDGGALGPVGKTLKILKENIGNPQRVAELIVAAQDNRITVIRHMVVALINEKRRVAAVERGDDPTRISYLKVRAPIARMSQEPALTQPKVDAPNAEVEMPTAASDAQFQQEEGRGGTQPACEQEQRNGTRSESEGAEHSARTGTVDIRTLDI